MKKKLWTSILTGFMLCIFAVSVWASEEDTISDTEEAVTDTTTEDSMVESYLTGLRVPESIGRQRPVSVMLNNIREGAPQSGISSAGVVYEAPVEGDITRLMGIFEDYKNLKRIGSVRSCRDYYLLYSNEFDAIYVHYGQSPFAKTYLLNHDIDNINGTIMGSISFYRSTDRVSPHNAYTNYELIQAGIDKKEYRRNYKEEYSGHYTFMPEGEINTLPNGTDANVVHFDNFYHNHPWYEYDETTGKYKRFQFGDIHIDDLTGEQLTCDNIIVQYSSCPLYANTSYLNIDPITGGTGKYITKGKAIDIIWMKDSPWGVTHYITMENQELQINRGTTWVEIVQDDRIDEITYE